MSFKNEDIMQRTASQWTDQEQKLLIQMTNAQIALEGEDGSLAISWRDHWKKVSSFLKRRGYVRSAAACQSYWKRALQEPQYNNAEPPSEEYDGHHPNDEPPLSTGSKIATPSNSEGPSPKKRHILQENTDSISDTSPQPKKHRAQYMQDAIGRDSVSPRGLCDPNSDTGQPILQEDNDIESQRTNSSDTIILAESQSGDAEQDENSLTCDRADSRLVEHDLARSQPPTILSTIPDDTAQRIWASKILEGIEIDMRAIHDAISAGNKVVDEINQDLENIDREVGRDLEAKNAAIARIKDEYELNLRALNSRRIQLGESRAREVERLNIKASERSNRMKLWEGYKGILDTLNGRSPT